VAIAADAQKDPLTLLSVLRAEPQAANRHRLAASGCWPLVVDDLAAHNGLVGGLRAFRSDVLTTLLGHERHNIPLREFV